MCAVLNCCAYITQIYYISFTVDVHSALLSE